MVDDGGLNRTMPAFGLEAKAIHRIEHGRGHVAVLRIIGRQTHSDGSVAQPLTYCILESRLKGPCVALCFGNIACHGLSQLRVHLVGYRHHVHEQDAEVHLVKVLLQDLEYRDL
jgi:hypothetical protein